MDASPERDGKTPPKTAAAPRTRIQEKNRARILDAALATVDEAKKLKRRQTTRLS